MCAVLSLAIHLATNQQIVMQKQPLFHKSKSQNKGLSELFTDLCKVLGITNITSHSVRKGAITEMVAATTNCISWAIAMVRARWKAAGKESSLYQRYVKYDKEGDRLAGRIMLAGLPKTTTSLQPLHLTSPNNKMARTRPL